MGQSVSDALASETEAVVFPAIPSSYNKANKYLTYMPNPGEMAIPAMLLPAADSSTRRWKGISDSVGTTVRTCVIFFHANACDIGDCLKDMHLLRDNVFSGDAVLLAPEYPGYGLLSDYKPSVESIDLVAFSAWRFCRKDLGFSAEQIILLGRSIGTGPAAALARARARKHMERTTTCSESGAHNPACRESEKPLGALILIAPFKSVSEVVRSIVDNSLLSSMFRPFWPIEEIMSDAALKKVPLMIVHPEADEVIPVEHGLDVFDAATSQYKDCYCVPDAQHNFDLEPSHLSEIRRFLRTVDVKTVQLYTAEKASKRGRGRSWGEAWRFESQSLAAPSFF